MPSQCRHRNPAHHRARPPLRARSAQPSRWWLNGDPVATAWHNALSATFPRGEAFFIEFGQGLPRRRAAQLAERNPRLREAGNQPHPRAPRVQPRRGRTAGYDIAEIDARVAEAARRCPRGRPPIVNLAVTMALEHFTAMFAQQFLANPAHFAGADERAGRTVALARDRGDRAQGRRLRHLAPRHARLEPLAAVEAQER